VNDAILRHGGGAYFVALKCRLLCAARRRELAAFLLIALTVSGSQGMA
jgi:hypothetical protein